MKFIFSCLFFVKIELRWHNELLNILYCNELFSLFAAESEFKNKNIGMKEIENKICTKSSSEISTTLVTVVAFFSSTYLSQIIGYPIVIPLRPKSQFFSKLNNWQLYHVPLLCVLSFFLEYIYIPVSQMSPSFILNCSPALYQGIH